MTTIDKKVEKLLKDLEKVRIKGTLVTKENLDQHENMEFSDKTKEENK